MSLAASELERGKQNEGKFSHAGGEPQRLVFDSRSIGCSFHQFVELAVSREEGV